VLTGAASLWGATEKEFSMLAVYTEIITVLHELRGSIETIERRDGDLGRQMRRAASSVALNAGEGQGSRGRNQQARFATALGSMRETKACLDVAMAFGYVDDVDAGALKRIDRICGMLYRLSR
jgi:four helix bundle protein